MKKFISKICLLVLFLVGSLASVSAQKIVLLSKVTMKKDPVITSPLPGSEISGPFVLVGKGEPNATVTIKVTPKNNFSANSTGRPRFIQSGVLYKEQQFAVTVNSKGFWQSEMIEVKFNANATDKKIQVFTSQTYDGGSSVGKTVEYKTPGMIMVMAPGKIMSSFDIKWPVAGSIVKEDSRISGTAKPGAVVKVMIHSGYYPQGGGAPRAGEKQELYATAGKDGKWETETANFNIISQQYSKSTYAIVASVENSSDSKRIEVIRPAETSVATSAFRVTSHKGTAMVPNGNFRIQGVAKPGAKILVERRYNGTITTRNNSSIIGAPDRININKKTDADFGSLSAVADQNGEWSVSNNLQKVQRGISSSETITQQVSTLFAKVSLLDDNGNKLKTESLIILWNLK